MSDPYTEGLKLLGLPVNVDESVPAAPMTEECAQKIVEAMKMTPEEYERHSVENPAYGVAVPLPEYASQMTLRDYFAGQCMISRVAQFQPFDSSFWNVAKESYRMADAMIAERSK